MKLTKQIMLGLMLGISLLSDAAMANFAPVATTSVTNISYTRTTVNHAVAGGGYGYAGYPGYRPMPYPPMPYPPMYGPGYGYGFGYARRKACRCRRGFTRVGVFVATPFAAVGVRVGF